jgi:ribose/xylose/arabinose/galactoside ABC-type transport system permease subunit
VLWPSTRGILKRQETGLAAVIIILGLLLTSANSLFLTSTNLYDIVQAVAVTGILAIGEAFILVAGEIDLSVGSGLGVSGVVVASAMSQGINPAIAIDIALTVGALIGLVQGSIVVYGKVNSFIVTLATLSIGRGLTELVSGGMPVIVPSSFLFIGQGQILNGMPVSIVLFIALVALAQVVLSRSVFGQRITAIGDNREAARLTGIPIYRTRILVFVLSGVMAAVGGVVFTSQVGVAEAQAGTGIELSVIAACVIGGASLSGGRGSMIGALLGACLLGTINNAFILLRLSPFLQELSIGLVIVGAVLFDQFRQGSFSRPRAFGGGPRSAGVPPRAGAGGGTPDGAQAGRDDAAKSAVENLQQ